MRNIDQDLHALTAQYLQDQLAIMKRNGHEVKMSGTEFEKHVRTIAAVGQALREAESYAYTAPNHPAAA